MYIQLLVVGTVAHYANWADYDGPRIPPHSETTLFRSCCCNSPKRLPTERHSGSVIQLFCRSTREFFQVDGAYFWRVSPPDELVGAEADGLMAEDFRGRRLKARESAVAMEAIRQRRTVYVNRVDPSRYPMAAEFHAKSLMAAPLVVANEVIGAAVFLRPRTLISFTTIWRPKPPFWPANWAACWKPTV